MRLLRLSLLLCWFALGALRPLHGQSVRWEPPSGTLAFNQTSELQLVFEGCEPQEDPAIPAVPGLLTQQVGRSSNMSIVNGRISQTVLLTYRARATQRAGITIPPFPVATNKGRLEVPAATYEVGEATVGQGNVALDRVASARLEAPKEVWAGEVFAVDYALNIARRYFHSPGSATPDWNPAPLTVEEWAKPEVSEITTSGEPRVVISYHARGSLKTQGDITLNPASQLVNLSTGTPSFGFFARPNLEQYAITSNRPTVRVRPLPLPAPAGFGGAVGAFKLESKVVPETAAVGEPITWTLTLSGTGNWPEITSLPSRDVSRDFRVVQPQARRTPKEGTLFEATLAEDVVLIPTQPGSYTLGPLTWAYFDPAKGAYQTVTTERVTVTVSPAAIAPSAPAPSAASPASPATVDPGAGSNARRPIHTPTVPQPIPSDPSLPASAAPLPWTWARFAWTLAVPVVPFVGFWLYLAWRRAAQRDPRRPQREAHIRMRQILQALRGTREPDGVSSLLHAWQREAAILWEIPTAAPAAHQFERVTTGAAETRTVWARLWRESETALYGSGRALPADWVDRAEAAWMSKPAPRFAPLQLFRPSNLLPFAAVLLLALAGTGDVRAADPGFDAYSRGDFPAAEAVWRRALQVHATDWSAHHNLGLALAQQNRWGEASAHTAAAFVQHPSDPSVQWNFAVAVERAGFAPGPLAAFVHPSPLHSMARLFSPARWQRVLVGALALAAAGGALLLLFGYGQLGRWGFAAGAVLLSAAVLTGIVGSVSLGLYQEAGDARAAIVWKPSILRSIPTEADTTQKTTPLAPGTMARMDKTFLGWVRLAFPNGQTGWVRREDLVALWQ